MATSSPHTVLPAISGLAAPSWQKPGDMESLAARQSGNVLCSHPASKAEAVTLEGGLEGYWVGSVFGIGYNSLFSF